MGYMCIKNRPVQVKLHWTEELLIASVAYTIAGKKKTLTAPMMPHCSSPSLPLLLQDLPARPGGALTA